MNRSVVTLCLCSSLLPACGANLATARLPASPGAEESWLAVESWPDGSPRHVIVEDVLPADRTCVPTLERHFFYDENGWLVRRETARIRCGVVERREVETLAPVERTRARSLFVDIDRDGRPTLAADYQSPWMRTGQWSEARS